MNGVELAVHQSSSRTDRRKLVSTTRSPSRAVVSESKELDLPFIELEETNPFDWGWWPAR